MRIALSIILYMCVAYCNAQTDTTSTGIINKEPIKLNEVVVESHRIISNADKYIMHVPVNENKDGEELLRQAPSVVFNGNDITINGEGGTKVVVNGREIRLQGDNLINYIRSLNSKDIERIEVQPMAGASDDADAKGGIIRIMLRHKQKNDNQGNIAIKNMVSNKSYSVQPSASFNMHNGKWDFYAFGSNTWTTKDKGVLKSTRIYQNEENKFESHGDINQPSNNVNVCAGAFYNIDSVSSIGAEVGYFRNYNDMKTDSYSTLVNETNTYNSSAKYSQKMDFNMFSGSINYNRKFDNKGSVLKIMADYAKKESSNNDLYSILSLWNNSDTTYKSHLTSNYSIASADLSYKNVYSASTYIQTGLKFTTTQMCNNNSYQSLYNNTWISLPAFDYASKYNEYIWAGYAEINSTIKNWQIAAGLRAENTKTTNRGYKLNHNYFNLYPHITLGYSFDEMKRWMISLRYARQIERPAFDALNPNRIQISQYSYQVGNPDLRPTYINKISATLIHDYSYTLTIGCNLHRDLIREFAKQDPADKNVSYITYENHNHENHWFININAPIKLGSIINIQNNITAVRQCIQTDASDKYMNHNLIFINCIAGINLPQKSSIELEYNMHNQLYSGNSSIEPRNIFNIKAKKTFYNDNILLTAGIDNILNASNRYQCLLNEYLIKNSTIMGTTGRKVIISITYNFKTGNKIRQRRVENSSEEDRKRMSQEE
ncbi:MAG: TonB-dependent receptor [Prevotella sp.]|nr:TonB-dependent receptor [Prevotella sp.]